jgi:ribonuclease D
MRDLVARLAERPRVALDTEGNSLFNYFERVCLLQLSFEDEHFLVDPLGGLRTEPLYEALAECPLILHAAENDFRMLYTETEFVPRGGVFDTLLAAQLLGREQLSLAALVEGFAGVTMCKKGQKSNWARRPLTADQLTYAVDDTKYLPAIAEQQEQELLDLGRLEWHAESCARVAECGVKANGRDRDDAWRVRGAGKLRRRELAYLRELWRWRDEQSQDVDKPPFKILGNEELLSLARWAAAHPGQGIEKGPRLPRHCGGGRLMALKGALKQAHQLPRDEWPVPRPRVQNGVPQPSFKDDVDRLRAISRQIGTELGIEASVIAPRSALEAIARNRPQTRSELVECSGLMNWQINLLRDHVLPLFTGQAASNA